MRALCAALLACILLPACGSGHGRSGSNPTASPTTNPAGPTTSEAAHSTTAAPAPSIAWNVCPTHAGWECGSMSVPLDHRHPGETISLALTRHRAGVPAERVGSLLVNPGGPGASGIDFAYQIANLPALASLVRDFDLVGFDPRGVGASTPIHCVDGPTLDRINHVDPTPDTAARLAAVIDVAKQLAAGCQAQSARLLPHVSTIDAAKDMEDIRVALGDPTLTYMGFSYGTLLGATYANLYPTKVRAMMLDAAVDPAIDEGAMSMAQAVGFEQNLNAFLASCTASCAFKAHGAPTLRAAFDNLMARIRSAPIPAGTRSLGPGEALLGVAEPLYSQAQWPNLAIALERAWDGDGSGLMQLNDAYMGRRADGTFDNSLEANTAINCLDHPVPSSIAGFQQLAAAAAKQAPFFGPPLAWGAIACLYWPVPPVSKPGPVKAAGAPPIVVIGTTGDPATPYAWAEHLTSEFDDGILVTRDGDGHGAYLQSQCVRNALDAYLIKLVKPVALTCAT